MTDTVAEPQPPEGLPEESPLPERLNCWAAANGYPHWHDALGATHPGSEVRAIIGDFGEFERAQREGREVNPRAFVVLRDDPPPVSSTGEETTDRG